MTELDIAVLTRCSMRVFSHATQLTLGQPGSLSDPFFGGSTQ
jgi:hypothetical protein